MEQVEQLLDLLENRFNKNKVKRTSIKWTDVKEKLTAASQDKLKSLLAMEESGGEPDVVWQNKKNGTYMFVDCALESPKGRRSLCFDPDALESRKEHKPKGSAKGLAADMGIRLLTEEEYFKLQELGAFDLKTSSWLETPSAVRALGGAIFGDRRYDRTFIYHNGAESYYASRGFRGLLEI